MMIAISQVMTTDASSPTRISLTISEALSDWGGSLGVSLLRLVDPISFTVQKTESRITHTTIDDLSSLGYRNLDPIPVEIEFCADDEFIARWSEAGVAITSDSATDALLSLKIEIVEVYEILKREPLLGRELQLQLAVLESYLGQG